MESKQLLSVRRGLTYPIFLYSLYLVFDDDLTNSSCHSDNGYIITDPAPLTHSPVIRYV